MVRILSVRRIHQASVVVSENKQELFQFSALVFNMYFKLTALSRQ